MNHFIGIYAETKGAKGFWLGKTGFSKKTATRKLQRSSKWFWLLPFASIILLHFFFWWFFFWAYADAVCTCVCLIMCSQKAKNDSGDGHPWDSKAQERILCKEQRWWRWWFSREAMVTESGKLVFTMGVPGKFRNRCWPLFCFLNLKKQKQDHLDLQFLYLSQKN